MYIYVKLCCKFPKLYWTHPIMEKYCGCILKVISVNGMNDFIYKIYDNETRKYWYYKSERIIELSTPELFEKYKKVAIKIYE